MDTAAATVAALAADLRDLGVARGDTVMVHASLRRIGPVEGGAAGVISALEQAVGDAGTLLMLLGARDDFAWVNERPAGERDRLLAGTPAFDADTTPASPEVGTLAEVFRCTPATRVSDNPEGRFAARGRDAAHLLHDAPWDDYFGPGSPLDRLCRKGGTVLRLGADPDTVSVLHYAEYVVPLPGKRRVTRHRLVAASEGPVVRTVSCLDDEHGIFDYAGDDYFAVILREYLAAGRARTGVVGSARSELILASDIVAFGVDWMTANLVAPA